MNYEVKQSKTMIIIGCIAAGILTLFYLGVAVFLLCYGLKKELPHDEAICCYCGAIFALIFAICIFISVPYLAINYTKQVDVYTKDKMYRKKGSKIVFEVPYKNIVSIQEGFNCILLYLNGALIKTNGKKGPKTLYEHYSQADIKRIKSIIADYSYLSVT